MNLRDTIALRCDYQDHFEYFNAPEVIPTAHPPSLRNPKKVVQQLPSDGWHKGDSKKAKERARRDMKLIVEKTLRQSGRPVMVRHAKLPVPSIFETLS